MTTIKLRRGTAAQWSAADPILAQGEPGFESDTNKHKIGDGTSSWSALKYFVDELAVDNKVSSEATARSNAITAAVNGLVNGAPEALDTLKELSDALGSDESAASTLTTLVGTIRNLSDSTHKTALLNALVPKWQANTAYVTGDVVMAPDGSVVKRLTNGTSGSSYTSANWQSVATVSGTQVATELANTYSAKDGRTVVAAPNGSGGADTGKIADAIAAAKTAGGRKLIQLQPGTYSVDPDSLILDFDNVILAGSGVGVTSMTKTGNGDLILIKAASDAAVVQRAQVRDIKLNGGDFTGALIKSVYGSQCHIKAVEFNANNDIALDLIRPWDTVIDDVFLDHCGSTSTAANGYAMSIRNSSAASGFGYSAGQANMVYSRALRIESCPRALQVIRGTGSTVDPYHTIFHGMKVETYFAKHGNQIDVVNVRSVVFRDLEMALLGLATGQASAVNAMNWAPLFRSKLDGIRLNVGTSVVAKGFDMWLPGSGSHEVANVMSDGASTGLGLFYWNNVNPADIRGCYTQNGTLHANMTPTTDAAVRANTQTASYTLVAADRNSVIEMNVASANALTVPKNSVTPFPIGTIIEVHQYGAGQTTITPVDGTVTIRTSSSLTTRAQYSTVSLRKRGTDEWVAVGDLT